MAGQESLGRAILYLSVDDTALRDGVRRARQFVDRELGRRTGGQGGNRGGGGNADRAADRRASTMVITRNLGERLNRLEERGVNVARIRAALDRAALATDQGRLEVARSLNKISREFIVNEERRLKGSGRIGRQLADPINALFDAQKRRYSLDQQIRSLEAAGINSDRLRVRLGEVTTAQSQRRFGLAQQLGDQLNFDLKKERDKLKIKREQDKITAKEITEGKRIGSLNTSPILGGLAFPGSPKFLEAQRKAAEKQTRQTQKATQEQARQATRAAQGRIGRLSSALIGGAFPLLFGQGPGAALGGAIGGAAGGGPLGFGLSLVGTALGAAFDTAIQKAQVLAGALDSPVQKFQELAAAGLISSKGLENQIQALLDTGRVAEAAALLQQDLADNQFDVENVKRLQEATQTLNNSWNDFSITLAGVAAGPLSDVIAAFNKLLGGSVGRNNFSNLDKEIATAVAGARRQRQAERATQISTQLDPQILAAQLSNDKLRTLELQKQKLTLDQQNQAAAFGTKTEADKIRLADLNNKFKLEDLRLTTEITKETQRRAVEQLKLQSATGAFGKTQAQQTFEQVAINVADVLSQFGAASIEYKVAIQEGANTLLASTQNAAVTLRDAFRGLRDLRLGNLRFLSPQDRQALIQQQTQAALPEAQRRGVTLRGFEDVVAFNRFIEQDIAAQQSVIDAQRNMVDANNALNSSIITQTGSLDVLTSVMNRLVDKSWSVNVQVPGQNGTTALNLQNQLN